MARAVTQCDQCGAQDDHPKAHLGETTKHHDCLSVAEAAALAESVQPESQVAASAIVAKCQDGTRGDQLLAFIAAEQAKTDKRLSKES